MTTGHPLHRTCLATAALLSAVLAAGCSHRSVANVEGVIEIGDAVRLVRLEIENGTIDLGPRDPVNPSDELVYKGGIRRDAASAEELERLEAVAVELRAEADPADPTVLVVRAPVVPDGVTGMIAFEAGVRIPETIPVEVHISDNGHVTIADRRARTEVRTGRGDLRFENCSGGIEAKTGQGVLIAFGHRGDLDVQTAHGDMQVFIEEAGDLLMLRTGKGTVQCNVPADLEFEVDARASIGRIGNDFGLEVRKLGDYSAAMTGRRGSGATRIVLRTESGHIDLVARKRP